VVFNWHRLYSEGKLSVETTQAKKLLPVSLEEREIVDPPAEEAVVIVNFKLVYPYIW
jgi:transposase